MPRRRATTRVGLWFPPAAYMAVIFVLSSQTAPLPELTSHVSDKLLHALEYLVLSVLLVRALSAEGATAVAAAILATVIASAYGASDEYHQKFVPGRSSDVNDWIVDTLGAAAGAAAYARRQAASRAAGSVEPEAGRSTPS
jgi:VanZ family protein